MFDRQTVDQLRGVIREAVRDVVRVALRKEVPKIVRKEIHDIVDPQIARLDCKIDDLRADMQAQFVAQRRGIVMEVCEFIDDHVLPLIPVR